MAAPPPYSNIAGEKGGNQHPTGQDGFAQPPPPQAGYPYPQPQPAAYPQPQQNSAAMSTNNVVVTQPVASFVMAVRESPVRITCPNCNADVITATEYEVNWVPWVACVFLVFFGCFLGCCLIPFCLDSLKDVVHKCPNCKHQISVWRRFS